MKTPLGPPTKLKKVNGKLAIRECSRCEHVFLEDYIDERSRRLRLAKLLCPNCLREFEQIKKQRKISPIYYLGVNDEIPEFWRYNPESDTSLNMEEK